MRKINFLEILFWIVMVILFIMILSRMLGKSAEDFQIYLGFFTGLLIVMGYLIKLTSDIGNLNREVGEMKVGIKHSFNKVKKETILLRNNMNLIREDTSSMKKDIKEIKENIQKINKKLKIK